MYSFRASDLYRMGGVLLILNYHFFASLTYHLTDVSLSGTNYGGRAAALFFSLWIIISHFRTRMHPLFYIILIFWTLWFVRLILDSTLNPEALRESFSIYSSHFWGVQVAPSVALYFLVRKHGVSSLAFSFVALIILISMFLAISNENGGLLNYGAFRRGLDMEGANTTGLGYLALFLAISGVSLELNSIKTWKKNTLKIILICISGLAILAFASRIIIALFLVLLLFSFWNKKCWKCFLGVSFLVPFIIWHLSSIEFSVLKEFAFYTRMQSFTEDSIRSRMMFDAIKLIYNSPLIGGGIEPLGWYPHNLILEAFMVAGLTSGLLFLTIYFWGLYISYKLMFSQQQFFVGYFLFSCLIGALVAGNLYNNQWFWMALTMGIASYKRSFRDDRKSFLH